MAVTSSMKQRRHARSAVSEGIVLASMATVSAVLAAVLVLQLGTPVWAASAIAAMFLAAVLAAHVLVRRSEQIAILERELQTLDERLGRVAAGAPRGRADAASLPQPGPMTLRASQPIAAPPAGVRVEPVGRPGAVAPTAPTAASAGPTAVPLTAGTPLTAGARLTAAPLPEEHVARAPADKVQHPGSAEAARADEDTTTGAATAAGLAAVAADLAARPVPTLERVVPASLRNDPEAPASRDGRVMGGAQPAPIAEVADEPPIEALLAETAPRPPIDDLLKRLAGDISNGAGLRDVRVADDDATTAPALVAPWAAPDLSDVPDAVTHEMANLTDAVEAETAEFAAAEGKVAALVDALSNERIDLFLEPIIGFETLAPEHYDVTVRLRLADGSPLDAAQYSDAARGTGLLALIDTVKIARAKRFVTETMVDGSERVLNRLDAETLTSEQFHEDIAELAGHGGALAGRLVLTFRQSDVRGFAPVEWQALARLAALGFRFGVDAITDLDMDFAELAAGGFIFARLDADVLLDGMMVSGGARVSPSDVCRHLSEAGLGLVVRRIDDPKLLARVMGFGVMMGQGAMFGGARRAEDISRRPRHDA